MTEFISQLPRRISPSDGRDARKILVDNLIAQGHDLDAALEVLWHTIAHAMTEEELTSIPSLSMLKDEYHGYDQG